MPQGTVNIAPTMTVEERVEYARSLALEIGGLSDEDRLMRAFKVVLGATVKQTIERCARVADTFGGHPYECVCCDGIAASIRALPDH